MRMHVHGKGLRGPLLHVKQHLYQPISLHGLLLSSWPMPPAAMQSAHKA